MKGEKKGQVSKDTDRELRKAFEEWRRRGWQIFRLIPAMIQALAAAAALVAAVGI